MHREISEKNNMDQIDARRIPYHVAVIMDGNGRWAQKNNLPRAEGHRKGVDVIRDIVKAADDVGVKVLTLYAFSTENWKRPGKEVFALMQLMKYYLRKETRSLQENNVRIRAIGDLAGIPPAVRKELFRSSAATENNTGLSLNLAINYGGRPEIIEAVKKIAGACAAGSLSADALTQELFEEYLYTAGLPDPDLLIRTGGEFRISNFLLWQIAYTELWVTSLFWPEFGRKDFYSAILDYQNRKRRFGGLN